MKLKLIGINWNWNELKRIDMELHTALNFAFCRFKIVYADTEYKPMLFLDR